MLGYYNYTVILTYISLIISVLGMHLALLGNIKFALICLLLSGICDAFDGPIARTMKRNKEEKEFGIQIDSLVDLICFGVFPAIIGYSLGETSTIGIIIIAWYILAAVIRLAYFNVQESVRQSNTTEKRKVYQGLPVTCSSLIFPIAFCVCKILKLAYIKIYPIILLIVGILFVCNFNIKKAKKNEMILMGIIVIITFIYILK